MTTPFKINLSSKDIADLQQRLNNTRWPDQLDQPANNKWEYGSDKLYERISFVLGNDVFIELEEQT